MTELDKIKYIGLPFELTFAAFECDTCITDTSALSELLCLFDSWTLGLDSFVTKLQ